jgi:SNF2 family DNA or RNA helicase
MSHGLTLTYASTVIWYAPITSSEVYTQANGRVTRPGQTRTQFIVHVWATMLERRLYDRIKNNLSTQGLLLEMFEAANNGKQNS